MPSPRAAPREANRQRLPQRLLDAVEGSLEQTGQTYAELSVERLLEKSGVARSTFYYHFKDKHSLIAALAQDVFTELEQEAFVWWDDPITRSSLEQATADMFGLYWRHRVVIRAAAEIAATDATVREHLDKLWRRISDEGTRRMEIGQQEQLVRAGIDPRRTADWLVWMTERGLYQLIRRGDKEEFSRYAATYVDIVWSTLGASRQE